MSAVHTFRLDLTWDLLQAISRVDRFLAQHLAARTVAYFKN